MQRFGHLRQGLASRLKHRFDFADPTGSELYFAQPVPEQPKDSMFLRVGICGVDSAGKTTLINCLAKQKALNHINSTTERSAVYTDECTQIELVENPSSAVDYTILVENVRTREDSIVNEFSLKTLPQQYRTVNALHGFNVDALRSHLLSMAKPSKFRFHSSVTSARSKMQIVQDVLDEKMMRIWGRLCAQFVLSWSSDLHICVALLTQTEAERCGLFEHLERIKVEAQFELAQRFGADARLYLIAFCHAAP